MTTEASNRLGGIQEYYFSRKLEEIRNMDAAGDKVLNLGIGNPDMMPSPEVVAALNRSASQIEAHGYQSYKGIMALRKAITSHNLKTYSAQLDPATEILPLLGSKEGISHISMAFLNPNDEVLVPDPGYPTYASVTTLAGGKPIYYNLREDNDWSIDWDQINGMDLSKVKLMWVNYPNMPTGAKGNLEQFKEIVSFGIKHDILICHDNPYSRILNDSPLSMLSIDGAKEVVLELNSLSKSHNMAGWRLGWVAGSSDHISTVLRYKSNIDSGMFLPIQMGGIAALEQGGDWFKTLNDEYGKRREIIYQILDNLNCTYVNNQAGLFVWAKMPQTEMNAEEFCDEILQDAKVFLAPGTVFGNNGEGYIRASLCSTVKVLSEAAKRISKLKLK